MLDELDHLLGTSTSTIGQNPSFQIVKVQLKHVTISWGEGNGTKTINRTVEPISEAENPLTYVLLALLKMRNS